MSRTFRDALGLILCIAFFGAAFYFLADLVEQLRAGLS